VLAPYSLHIDDTSIFQMTKIIRLATNGFGSSTHISLFLFCLFFFWSQCRYDRVRGVEIGNKDIKLEYLEEAFTTSNWIVRIYKVKPPKNRS
jgi:hypothetical protein